MGTYTLAIADGVLFACLPDDADVAGAVAAATAVSYGHGIALDIVRGTVLTDAAGEGDEVVFAEGLGGELADASGRCWRYAVRRASPAPRRSGCHEPRMSSDHPRGGPPARIDLPTVGRCKEPPGHPAERGKP